MPQALPANPDLDWLKKAAKKRLVTLRAAKPTARLYEAQLAVANDYGFKSWRALKAHVETVNPRLAEHDRVFDAARAGDIEAVRRALASGFDPATPDRDGRTIFQIAKERRHRAIEMLTREVQGGPIRSGAELEAVQGIASAAQSGDVEALRQRLDARPDLINALAGRGFPKATALHLAAFRNQHQAARLLIERGADLDAREFPDNAAPLHFVAMYGDLDMIRLLVAAGADVDGKGDDPEVGIRGWATCFRQVREDVAEYLLGHGATLNLWSAIALDRVDDVRANYRSRARVARCAYDPPSSSPHAPAPRGCEKPARERATAARTRRRPERNRCGRGNRADDGRAGEADPAIASALLAAGARLDFLTAVNLGRYGEAGAMLREDPARIGPDGRDTIALHLAVSMRNLNTICWLLAHGVDVNAKRLMWDCDHTALHMTVENGEMDIARVLLDAGADPNIRDDKFNSTALGWAEFFGRADFAELLREKGGAT
jgi:ankyrin repeat protein